MEDIILFFAGRIAGATGSAAYQDSRAQRDQSFRQMRTHMGDAIHNVVNMRKPHDAFTSCSNSCGHPGWGPDRPTFTVNDFRVACQCCHLFGYPGKGKLLLCQSKYESSASKWHPKPFPMQFEFERLQLWRRKEEDESGDALFES